MLLRVHLPLALSTLPHLPHLPHLP